VGNEELESMEELTELEMQPIGDENRMSETGEFENDDNFEEIKEEIKKAEQSVASSGTAEHVFPPMELLRQPITGISPAIGLQLRNKGAKVDRNSGELWCGSKNY